MRPPTKADWGEVNEDDLDALWAYKQFLGKSFEEAEEMFERNALYYQEDLSSMPPIAFNFYAPALAKYIISERAREDSDGASSFLNMVIWILKNGRDHLQPETERLLVTAACQVSGNQAFYDADVEIYGNFHSQNAEIESLTEFAG